MALLDQAQQTGRLQGGSAAPTPAPTGAGGAPVEEGSPGAASAPGGGAPAGDQEAQIAQFLDNAWRYIYGGGSAEGEINPEIAEMLRSGAEEGGPQGQGQDQGQGQGQSQGAIKAIATTAATIGGAVASSAVEQNVPVDGPGVVLPSTIGLLQDLAEVAQAEGIHTYTPEELASAAMLTAEMLFEQTKELGLWNQAEFDEGVQELFQANQTGEIEQIFPSAAAAVKGIGGEGGGAPPAGAAPATG